MVINTSINKKYNGNYTPYTNSIFDEGWWLDCVAKNAWKKIVIGDAENPRAVFRYVEQRKYRFRLITMPPLTQTSGIWINKTSGKVNKIIANEKKVVNEVINKLGLFDYFCINNDSVYQYSLPYYWRGFSQTTRYTYVINDLSSLDTVWQNFTDKTRNITRNEEKKYKVATDVDFDKLYENNQMTFSRKKVRYPFEKNWLKNVCDTCISRNQGKMFHAVDQYGNVSSSIYTHA